YVKDQRDKTLLYYSVLSGSFEVAQWLVDQGFDVNAKSKGGCTILHSAVSAYSPISEEVLEAVEWLVEHGADINAKTDEGESVLLYAVIRQCDFAVIQYLVEQGAEVNEKDKYGDSILHIAIEKSKRNAFGVVQLLKEHGAKDKCGIRSLIKIIWKRIIFVIKIPFYCLVLGIDLLYYCLIMGIKILIYPFYYLINRNR
ncbi:MAG: ankyrin repeat domain-containing protein, partial [Thermoguttaceae bacterium]|nr:ankyrin repeat domain-containing protein [Thermoguttaceae bacterium]